MNTDEENAREEFYDQISKELYPEHKEQAIVEFTREKLKSYYLRHPNVMRPAVDAIQEGNWQLEKKRYSSSLVFYVIAIEILLKATLLRPVLYGLIHNENLAEIMVKNIFGSTGIDRYDNLIAKLFDNLTGIDFKGISREGTDSNLFVECKKLQKIRNKIIHQGEFCTESEASEGHLISIAVFEKIVRPMLYSIGLTVIERGEIIDA